MRPDVYADGEGRGVRRGGKQAAYFVCGLHISDSAECPPSMRRVFIRRSHNNLKPAPLLTLVHTQFHVAPTRDNICEALNKNDLLDIIKNNSGVMAPDSAHA